MSAPGLTAVADWDTALLDGAVFTLEAVGERLPPWRARVETAARALADAECWSGPAAQQAARALGEVSAAVTAVTGALGSSLDRLWDTARQARTAQELAAQALAEAAALGVTVDETGGVVTPAPAALPDGASLGALADHHAGMAEQAAAAERVAGLAADALHAAAVAAAHAAGTGEPLAAVGGPGAAGLPADSTGLSAAVALGGVWQPSCLPVAGTSPEAVAGWWAGLSEPARQFVVRTEPYLVGGLDGLPAWARDQANRLVLERTLEDPDGTGYAAARAAAAEIAVEEAAGRPVQLWAFDPWREQVAVAYGDLDTADSVALLVPGITNDVGTDLDDLGDSAQAVSAAAIDAAPAASVATVATVAWFGYRPPSGLGTVRAVDRGRAAEGGAALAGDLAGLAAARAADPVRPADPRVTVLAHSYGTVVADEAGDQPGRLAADALVLLGSPGIEEYDVSGLEVPEVYDASSPFDPVSYLGWFGYSTWEESFGSTALPTDWHTLHGEYYSPHHPTLAAMGEVVRGAREPG
ncbi:alpha/beta hydrolase family protein [Geodermatophilus tzadiensis]|uniref:Alpha/beta hydrolase family protein n=1 Tax=Geodermatophilus tzadiensis TaxID=1137988 RepID=A0A2T0TBZ6_9ACTN|nr:alpha/beta hydrolase [Geodermatophilus tzadiensis]PRY43175.1 alpha/beta hydrolase family protein [Geodermatophilus tzadiensis]